MSEQTLSFFVVALLSFLLCITRFYKGLTSLVFLAGFAAPLVAMLGAPAVLIVLLVALLLAWPQGVSYLYPVFCSWLVALGLPALLVFIGEGNVSMPLSYGLLVQLSIWLVALAWFGVFYLQPVLREAATRGTVFSVFFVVLVFVIQKIFPESLMIFPNSNSFWRGIGRAPATLSDPNALGIWSLIGVHLALGCSVGWLRTLGSLSFFCLGMFSGSRSFVLGAFISILVFFGVSLRTLSVLGAGSLLLLGVALQPELYQWTPSSIVRVSESIADISQGMQSRAVFFLLDLDMWLDYPFSGVGLGAFRFELPAYALRAKLLENGWTDNTNSFYLGVLAEQGLFGLAALILPFIRFRLNRSERIAVAGVISFLLVLIFGPHLEFAEIGFLFVLLAASGVRLMPASVSWRLSVVTVIVVTTVIIPLQFMSRTYGFYYPKRQESSLLGMRSGRRAQFAVPCNNGQCEFWISAPRVGTGHVVEVMFSPRNQSTFKLSLSGAEKRSVVLPASLRQSSLLVGLKASAPGVVVSRVVDGVALKTSASE
jgi:hypothetical protein